ncbi:MAG TPA: universal stress protein [Pyrinomonadaceae bacterium]|nr:universal stress protein [Pyrinomonadaceae bacterium]
MNKIEKILIAYDGSDYADSAIEDLRGAGLPNRLESLVLTATDAWELPTMVEATPPQMAVMSRAKIELIQRHLTECKERAKALADDGAKRVKEMFPDWNVSAEAVIGKPAWEIIKKAEEWEADLVTLGSHGRTAIGRVLLGSVSQKVLNEAHCSVRIARKREDGENESPRVLVAFDGSDCAETAVRMIAGRNWSKNTEFRIITADDDPFSRPAVSVIDAMAEGAEDSEEGKAWIEKMISKPVRLLETAGLKVSHSVKWGDARHIILREAETWKADSIFVGARGLSRFKRFLIGSVSSAVAAKAKCSVEVVR